MPRKRTILTPKDIARSATAWSRDELEEMRAIVNGLLEALDTESALDKLDQGDQRKQRGPRGGAYYEDKFIKGSGPYRYLRYWSGGKRKSVYVGKADDQVSIQSRTGQTDGN